MATKNPIEFIREVRQEAGKVAWPARRDTLITTGMVFVFVAVAAVFFTAVDWIISRIVQLLLGVS
jgi:preprotein translocase subunit SecE